MPSFSCGIAFEQVGMMVTRYAAEVSYNGAPYFGCRSSRQAFMQEALEKVLSMLDKRPVSVTGAGGQIRSARESSVCSFDMSKEWDEYRLLMAVNANLRRGHVNEADKSQARISREV